MKVLHTSDWHIGQKFFDRDRYEEHKQLFQWLIDTIIAHDIDVLLISGDIFDTSMPSNEAEAIYYNFLVDIIQKTICRTIIITAGNHDSPGKLIAPKDLLKHFQIHVIGFVTEKIHDEVIEIKDIDGLTKMIVAAVPFLRDKDIRKSTSGEGNFALEEQVKLGIKNHYDQVSDYVNQLKGESQIPCIAMGHLYVAGITPSESEREIHIGNLGQVTSQIFSDTFDYVALGHIHKPQIIGKQEHIRYSGSPIPLSFSERNDTKIVLILDFELNKLKSIEPISVPVFRKLHRFKGSLGKIKQLISSFDANQSEFPTWAEVIVETDQFTITGLKEVLDRLIEDRNIEILRIRLENNEKFQDDWTIDGEDLKDLKPIDIFTERCKNSNYNLDENKEILDAFNEILETYYQSQNQ